MVSQTPIKAVDFSSVFITEISAAAAGQLAASGVALAQIGFDPSPDSRQVRAALVGAGLAWDAYRFNEWSQAPEVQIASVIAGIHSNPLPLPGFLWMDIEEGNDGNAGPVGAEFARQLSHIMDLVEAADVKPTEQVKPGIYTRLTYWEAHAPPGYTEPHDRGWVLWTSDENPQAPVMYGGWTQAEGVQYLLNQQSPIGEVDYSWFRDRSAPPPGQPDVPMALTHITAAQSVLAAAFTDLSAALAALRGS